MLLAGVVKGFGLCFFGVFTRRMVRFSRILCYTISNYAAARRKGVMHLIIPKNYNPVLNLRDTEIAIKLVKDFFETE